MYAYYLLEINAKEIGDCVNSTIRHALCEVGNDLCATEC